MVLIVGVGLTYASEKQQCCLNGEVITSKGVNATCGNERLLKMNCTAGRMLLKEIIIKGDKVSTQDAPDITFVEDVSQ